jgi:phosphonate transport system ATP-binding protein
MAPLLQIRDLEVRAPASGQIILCGTNLTLDPGERVAVIGPSGAGKTTLFRAINGTVPISSGTLRFEDEDVASCAGPALRRLRRRIAVIAQKHDLVEALRVHQNVTAGALGRWSAARALRYLVWPTRAELEEAKAALGAVGLAHKLQTWTRTLSGGEQQRVAIARALLQAPALMIADEPVASLDPRTAENVLKLLRDLAAERGVALLCSLHQPDLAARFFDRIVEVKKRAEAEAAPALGSYVAAALPA